MKENTRKDIERVDYWLEEISKVNNNTIDLTEELHLILLNLKIVSAYIDKTIGMEPVIDQLERIVTKGNKEIKTLVSTGRRELRESWNEIKKELEEN